MGASLPTGASSATSSTAAAAAADPLLQRLLGKKAAKARAAAATQKHSSLFARRPGAKRANAPPLQEESDDEEEGRTKAVGRTGAKTNKGAPVKTAAGEGAVAQKTKPRVEQNHAKKRDKEVENEIATRETVDENPLELLPKRRKYQREGDISHWPSNNTATSYLNELLAQKAAKRRKRPKPVADSG